MTNIRNQDIIIKFGKRLKQLREERGLSQEQLANDADIPINQVGRIERGEVNTTLSTIFVLAEALGISMEKMVEG